MNRRRLAGAFPAMALATVVLVAGAGLGGCVGTQVGQMNLPREAAVQAVYYVEHQPKDNRGLDALIAAHMRSRGLAATSGGSMPDNATLTVSYIDKWQWDMRMYLFDLRIEVRDRKDNTIVGYGESMQSSLKAMGKTFDDIIDGALDQLFKK